MKEDLINHVSYRHKSKSGQSPELNIPPKSSELTKGKYKLAGQPIRRKRNNKLKGISKYRFKCPKCSNLFLRLTALLLHHNERHERITQCPDLNPGGSSSSRLTVEILSFSTPFVPPSLEKARNLNANSITKIQVSSTIHVCPVPTCQQPFHFPEDLKDHSKLHGLFSCNFCDIVKEYVPDLAEHELFSHSGKRIRANAAFYKCPRCRNTFSTKVKYLAHHQTTHLNISLVDEGKCAICGLCLRSTFKDLIRHCKDSHGLQNEDAIKSAKFCKIPNCSAYFLRQKGLSQHIKLQHGGVSPSAEDRKALTEMAKRFKCQDCDRAFKSAVELRCHRQRMHMAVRPHRCSVPKCTAAFESEEELQRHMNYQHFSKSAKFIDCPKCQKSFNPHRGFALHMRRHEREELIHAGLGSVLQHICETCGKCFKFKASLEIHSLSHSGPESWEFTCDVCSKKCMTQQKLDEHMRTHSKEKPFVCQICGQKYAHRHNLRIHVNGKHGDIAEDKAKPRKSNNDAVKAPSSKLGKGVKRKRKATVRAAQGEGLSGSSD